MPSLKNLWPYIAILVAGLVIGVALGRVSSTEYFVDVVQTDCNVCHRPKKHCGCPPGSGSGSGSADRPGRHPEPKCDKCPKIDWSKYILRASIPPCPPQPDLSRYMLKTECPAPPDMSRYVLKSAVPPCPPCISTCNKPCKIGDCPPCPRPRCPVVTCPEPKSCPPCAPVEPPRCPEPKVHCKANYEPEEPWMVRPLLASISGM
jgi:hypothetical protein